jgi:hypothetical protein
MSVTIHRFTASDALYKFLKLTPGTFIDRRWAYDKIIEYSLITKNTMVLESLCENEGNHLRYNFMEEFEYKITYDSIIQFDSDFKNTFMNQMKQLARATDDEPNFYQIWLESNTVFDIYDKTNNLQVLIDLEKDYIRSMEKKTTDRIVDKYIQRHITPEILLEQFCYFHVLNLRNYIKISGGSLADIVKKSVIYNKGNIGTNYLL